ncbi:MAG TPA: hypothetical protein VFE47_29590 [Tepidisphaeraceae bacterium]|nr:hypothetical protein [Tepidisphaeraceae bacterium]
MQIISAAYAQTRPPALKTAGGLGSTQAHQPKAARDPDHHEAAHRQRPGYHSPRADQEDAD